MTELTRGSHQDEPARRDYINLALIAFVGTSSIAFFIGAVALTLLVLKGLP